MSRTPLVVLALIAIVSAVAVLFYAAGQPHSNAASRSDLYAQQDAASVCDEATPIAAPPSSSRALSPKEAVEKWLDLDQLPPPVLDNSTPSMVALADSVTSTLAENRRLQQEIDRLNALLEDCRLGADSPVAIMHALPEWAGFDRAQQLEIADFIAQFPVKLSPGEAAFIVSYRSNGGDRMAEIIAQLGPDRVLASMSKDARENFKAAEPDRYADYFGTR